MHRTFRISAGFFQNINNGKNNFFTSLWNKPQTRDERIKEYVPEVIDESLKEQKAVLAESTARDIIVELGHKVLREIENKSPTPSIAPHLCKILKEYGSKDIIAQRPLSYLLYPNSNLSGGQQPHELVASFTDNFRSLIDEVERNGCSARIQSSSHNQTNNNNNNNNNKVVVGNKNETVKRSENENKEMDEINATAKDKNISENLKSGPVIMTPKEEHEPIDITLFIKVVSAMALANIQHNDWNNALRCVDIAISHVIDATRLGGLLGMKAGILVHQKKYKEALEFATLAVEASGNIQGYIHGAFALRILNKPAEAIDLLEKGREIHPMNMQIVAQLEEAQKQVEKLAKEEKKMITS